MRFEKQITTCIAIFVFSVCFSQKTEIDKLKKMLISSTDTATVDCLNQLSSEYTKEDQRDSAEHYASLAYEQGKRLNYVNGIAVSICRRSVIARHFDNDFSKSESLGKESLRWFGRTANKEGINELYSWLSTVAFAQSEFQEALDYAKKAYAHAKKSELEIMNSDLTIGAIYARGGDFEKAFSIGLQAYDNATKVKNKIGLFVCLWYIGQLYQLIEDYQSALRYFREMWQLNDDETTKWRIANDCDVWVKMEFAENFSHLNQFDSAWHYYNLFKPGRDQAVYNRVYWVSIGETYFLQKDYLQALQNFQRGLSEHIRLNDRNEILRTLVDIGKTYLAIKDDSEALVYGRRVLSLASQTKAKQFIRDGYQILYSAYDRLHQKDSANFYFRKYATIKEEVLSDQTRAKFAAYNYEQQITMITKEKLISQQQLQIKQQQLQDESQQKKILVGGIIAMLLLAGLIVRGIMLRRRNERQQLRHEIDVEKLEYERTKAEMQKQTAELEMQALRAQMNPHFIFNSLNSINMFILENNKLQASEYLSKFSRLVRLVLQNSQEALIPLEKELEALQLYLELESLRFDNKFEYSISVGKGVDIMVLKVPPLIIQPYVENAIWHGLMQKRAKGHLVVEFFLRTQSLVCKITDDGIGRMRAAELKSTSTSTHKSMGMRITRDRLAILQQQDKTSITIADLVLPDGSPGGTEVLIEIPMIV